MTQIVKNCVRCHQEYKSFKCCENRALYCPVCREIVKHESWNNGGREKHKECKARRAAGLLNRSPYVIIKDLSEFPLNAGLEMTTDEMNFHLKHKWIEDDSIISKGNINYKVFGIELVEI